MDPRARTRVDLTDELTKLISDGDPWLRRLARPPVATVAQGDGMYSGDGGYYLFTGVSALQLIQQSLEAACRVPGSLEAIADYACGYGRVTRWLQAAFPKAALHAADTNAEALQAVSDLMGVPATCLQADGSVPLPVQFDLIWVGSLVTHLDARATSALLAYLARHLRPGGLVVITTHGSYVANRLRTREKTYNLDEAAIARVLEEYDRSGVGFSPYPKAKDYGISVIRPERMNTLAVSAGYELLFFKARGWVKHQDCYGLILR